ncbi:zinc finger MYM-type protein 1-like [Zingiber officinale]|uniref:zinc finger MYM-type protein 1-like n=1 Tax=Zingiber officinale TaxID=94328 RepID=UPI001C4B66EE|nr:zinc finger MYM-type protein 1-like [Zingiber officinale]
MNENAPGNNQMKSPTVQKDLTRACIAEVTNVILNDIKDNIFSLMVDECRDISIKEQMRVVLRYVNKHECVIERFLAIVHVSDTSTISLKKTIDELFAKHKLSLSKLRGQGYDGASNMRGEYNGLKTLILKENSFARYVHCFAHQLQLVVVAVAKSNRIVSDFFQCVTMIVNIIGASCKRKDKFRKLEHNRLVECLEKGDIISGKGKHQEISLKRPGDTRWGSHYMTIIRLMSTWTSALQVLENVYDDGTNDDNNGITISLIDKMESYEFVFVIHLMKSLLGITNELSLTLQQKDQNIVLAVSLFKIMKVLDTMVQEMNNRFSESSTEVLTCIACLDPKDSFSQFDIGKLLLLAELYPEDFSLTNRVILEDQLETYIQNVRGEFSMIEDLGSLAKKMLALVLPVATASVEKVFSAMKIIKIDLRNRIGDEWMNDSLI